MYWIVQENVCQEEKWSELISVLKRLEINHSVHKVVPFSGELIPEHPSDLYGRKVFVYGSMALQQLSNRNGYKPGYISLDHANYSEQIKHWGDKMLNYNCFITTLKHWADEKFDDHDLDNIKLFVRPEDDSKLIKGQVMTIREIQDWANKVVNLKEDYGTGALETSRILTSEIKEIQQEVRFWIVDGQIATYSLYKLGNTITYSNKMVDPDMIWFASAIAANFNPWQPSKAYCLDLCRIDDKIKIVEINSINASGLYDADVNKLVMALERCFN